MGHNKQNLTQRIAEELIRTFPNSVDGESVQWLYEVYESDLRRRLKKLRPATLGVIAATGLSWRADVWETAGRTTLYDVHCGSWLDKKEGGKKLLLTIAMTAVAATMWDILKTRRRSESSAA